MPADVTFKYRICNTIIDTSRSHSMKVLSYIPMMIHVNLSSDILFLLSPLFHRYMSEGRMWNSRATAANLAVTGLDDGLIDNYATIFILILLS